MSRGWRIYFGAVAFFFASLLVASFLARRAAPRTFGHRSATSPDLHFDPQPGEHTQAADYPEIR